MTIYRYTGQRIETGTGLYDYGSRWSDPQIGRFLSADTIVPNPGDSQALNRYTYVANNPLKFVDPSGHRNECSAAGEGCGSGGGRPGGGGSSGSNGGGSGGSGSGSGSGNPSGGTPGPTPQPVPAPTPPEPRPSGTQSPESGSAPEPDLEVGMPIHDYVPDDPRNPGGTWGVGVTLSGGFFFGASGNLLIVWDEYGGVALTVSLAGGAYAGASAGGGIVIQTTNANSVSHLEGESTQIGGSVGVGPGGGIEYIVASSPVEDVFIQGSNVFGGAGIGFPVELHLEHGYTWILLSQ